MSEGDVKEFNEFVRGTVIPDLKEAWEAVKEDRASFRKWGVSNETIRELRIEANESRTEYEECVSSAIVLAGRAKVSWYNEVLAKAQNKVANLSAKGIDATEMTSVINGAESKVVGPLEAAVATDNSATIKSALHTYRLFNGGNESSVSYHFAAKFATAKLDAVLAKIAPEAKAAGYEAQVNEIQAKISAASALLQQIGDKKYTEGQREQVWGDIKSAGEQLRELLDKLHGESAEKKEKKNA